MMLQTSIRPYMPDDWPVVRRIYTEGIATGMATFDTKPKSRSAWESDSIPGSQIVAVDEQGNILAWALLWPASNRCVYRGVAEVSIYVSEDARGKGVGRRTLEALIVTSEKLGIWTLQAGIMSDNHASVKLHEQCEFRVIGTREKLAKLQNVWLDVIFMERRSQRIGT